ncbi:hypothetical protein [Chengkuizengella sediminis]|uniref:hypothetical protein n=1 Tax=Chengkuizengella sediminis TaxID=1885917 RepID=UPI00138A51B0|nr:hypothetical protein [Chengkuizengella sediminis]NDI36611.1 hypothetical protein [Chengkuizengella sediminis]
MSKNKKEKFSNLLQSKSSEGSTNKEAHKQLLESEEKKNDKKNDNEIKSVNDMVRDLSQTITSKPLFEDLYTRKTFYINNDLLEALISLTSGSRGAQTEFVNDAIRLHFKKLHDDLNRSTSS